MTSIFRVATVLALLVMTSACASNTCDKPQSYQQSRAGQPLVVPPGLSVPSGENKMEVPDTGANSVQPGECLDMPPRFVEVAEELELSGKEREERDRRDFIRNTMSAWAQSWAGKNLEVHTGLYDKRFKPAGGLSKEEFFAARAEQLEAVSTDIEIRLTEMTIDSTRKKATVRFLQIFTGENALDPARRELQLQFRGNRWKIVREKDLPTEAEPAEPAEPKPVS